MAVAAKFPAALLQLLADMAGTMPGRPNTELTLNADVLQATVAPFSLVVNEAIPAAWDQVGYLTVESEVLHHSAYNAGTKTFTIDARAQDGTVAALHSAGVRVGKWLTAVQWNQIVADVIALETQLGKNVLTQYAVGNSGAAKTIDWSQGDTQTVTMTANCTFTFTNPIAGHTYTLILTQDGTGSRTATWPATVQWPGGAPVLTTTATTGKDVLTFYYDGTAVKYLGAAALNYA